MVALFGATALGKTAVAVALAQLLGAEIVVADSMQVYRGLPILTNQPDAAQRAQARHHLVGFVEPQSELTVAEYAAEAHDVIDGLRAAGRRVIVEGGSGLYLRAALGDLTFAERPDPVVRAELETRWAREPAAVVEELRRLDPSTLARLDAANPRRVIRAIEAIRTRGGALTEADFAHLWNPPERYPHRLVALVPDEDRSSLRQHIETRVDEMLAGGALDEVARARSTGPFSRTALQAIGVRELCAVLDRELTQDEAAARIKSRTRALARRQLTWMRKLPRAAYVPAAGRPAGAVAADVLALLQAPPW